MPDFSLHDEVQYAPWTCSTCGGHVGRFVALNIEFPGVPNISMCEGCVTQAAQLIGFTEVGAEAELKKQLAEVSQRCLVYEKDLAEARENQPKVVAIEEVKEELAPKKRASRTSPKKTEEKASASKAAESKATATETKAEEKKEPAKTSSTSSSSSTTKKTSSSSSSSTSGSKSGARKKS